MLPDAMKILTLLLWVVGSAGLPLLHAADVPSASPSVAGSATNASVSVYAPRIRSGFIGQIERLTPEIDELLAPDAKIEVLAEGFDWAEGPVWLPHRDCLLFADVPRNVLWRWREYEGLVEYLNPSGYTRRPYSGGTSGANGLTLDNEGRLIICQHGDRQVARVKQRNQWEPLATNFQGKRLNSPNDVVLRSNGDVYFTDPPYGLDKGNADPRKELPFNGVYRVSRWGQVALLARDLSFPNGLAFSPDEKHLYVAVSDPTNAVYLAYEVQRDGGLTNRTTVFDATRLVAGRKGLPDGLKVDSLGNLWATGPGGVLILTPDGRHLGTIDTGEATANCAWGGDGSLLYLTANTYLCRIQTRVQGAIPGPLPESRRRI